MIVLDTNVISALVRRAPDSTVLAWARSQPSHSLATTAITEGEFFYGLAMLPQGRRRTDLTEAVAAILREQLPGRVFPFDSEAAREYGDIRAARRRAGRPIREADAQIAAIARSRGFELATRNVRDFVDCGIVLINPWEE